MQRSEAEEHLRVIRSLMEKATIYRAISAPTALIGGLASMVVAGLLVGPLHSRADGPGWFFGPWALVLGLTGAANGYVLLREARRRGDPFISPGMKMAFKALMPAHLVAGFFTVLAFVWEVAKGVPGLTLALPKIWCLSYGLGLLAMEHFAPRSLARLGWAFLLAGLAVIAFSSLTPLPLPWTLDPFQWANTIMFLTFGVLHVIYAACSWPRPGPVRDGFPV